MKTGMLDKNGKEIMLGDFLRTFDKKGVEWKGEVVLFDHTRLKFKVGDVWTDAPYPQFAFRSNYDTVLYPHITHQFEILNR